MVVKAYSGSGEKRVREKKKKKLPNHLIRQILLRCHLKCVCRCNCLSKSWNRNLSASSFRLSYISGDHRPQPPLLGFFHFMKDEDPDKGFSFLPTHLELGEPLFHLPEFILSSSINNNSLFRILGFSNGLVLCGDYPYFHVLNPISRQLFSLPPPNISLDHRNSMEEIEKIFGRKPWCIGFYSTRFDNDFKVIVPYARYGSCIGGIFTLLIETYSPKTGRWKQSELVAFADCIPNSLSIPTSIDDGTFLWPTVHQQIMSYNPYMDKKYVQLIEMPPSSGLIRSPSLCLSRHGLLQCAVDCQEVGGFRVYTLDRKLSAFFPGQVIPVTWWNLTYSLKLDMLRGPELPFRIYIESFWDPDHERPPQRERYAVRMQFHPLNPQILYFRIGQRIYSWDVEEGGVNLIPYGGDLYLGRKMSSIWPYVPLYWPPSPCPPDVS